LSIDRWADEFSIYSSVYRQKYHELTEQLATYQFLVRDIAQAGGNWYFYDTSFRRLKQNADEMARDVMEHQLYTRTMNLRSNNFRGQAPKRSISSSFRFRYNRGQYCPNPHK